MKNISIIITVIAVAAVLLLAVVWSSYNKLVTLNEGVTAQWAQVETQYQRRVDLIPNLVAAVKGAMKQEDKIFTEIANARTRYAGAQTVEQKVAAANEVESSLGRLLVIVENYPQLASLQNVQALQSQIEGTENRVSVERGRYNTAVQAYNGAVKYFPTNMLAKMFGFQERSYFQSDTGADKAPTVNFE